MTWSREQWSKNGSKKYFTIVPNGDCDIYGGPNVAIYQVNGYGCAGHTKEKLY
jgi:hypothetical protein